MYKNIVLLALTAISLVHAQELDLIFNTDTVNVKPNMSVNLDCGTRKDYRYCVWEHNNEIFQVEDIHDAVYPGMSKPDITDDNQCGIVLNSADTVDHGTWTCTIFIKGTSLVGNKDISIMLEPSEPQVSPRVIEAKATEEFEVMCSVMDARPAAIITWFVGDWEITSDSKVQNNFTESKGSYNTVSTLRHMFKPEEHGQQLICKVDHPTLKESMNSSLDLNVLFAPVEKPMKTFFDIKKGSDYKIMFNFTANPAPTKVMWKYGETEEDMITTSIPSENGEVMAALKGENGKFSVVLNIINVTEKDIEIKYMLSVENEFGSMDYQIMLTGEHETLKIAPEIYISEPMIKESNGGVIAGVLIVVLAIVITLTVVAYAHRRQMLCFAVRTESKAHIKGSQPGGLEKGETNEGIKASTDNIDVKTESEISNGNGHIVETNMDEKTDETKEKQ